MSNTRFSVAVHVLTVLHLHDGEPVSSSVLAGSVGTNPVVIRKLLAALTQASLVTIDRGTAGGARLLRSASAISLADVLDAVSEVDDMLKIHTSPNPACPVGRSIGGILDVILQEGFDAFRDALARYTVADLVGSVQQRERA
ncbi:Rrf2 family transcriptional regulator [Spongiibacter nanhainus]|uniref:Rrf2 family transcriptional regulator n=1 Tax=Spongiibacter nanhainus TaxID=2794344 RepID=A0A7T4UPA3_9GAMM|nr:Rrf2 family transcriptional regulator [Spongiibacter nanhainus]QQD17436.1 Rrf2 family transcriptional regulator [Spongiibacter nanhainus]